MVGARQNNNGQHGNDDGEDDESAHEDVTVD